MKKNKIFYGVCTSVLVSVFVFSVCGFNFLSKENDVTSTPTSVQIQSLADFAINYDSYEKLIADSDIIVSGTAVQIKPFFDQFDKLYSKIEFSVQNTIKGNVSNNTITVLVDGGSILLSQYLEKRSEYMKTKLTPEVYEQQLKQAKISGEKLESIWCGVENIEQNENLLLFLTLIDDSNEYIITGTSYYGKFKYDENSKTIYREVKVENDSSMGRGKTTNIELQSNVNNLEELVKRTNDNSENRRNERKRVRTKGRTIDFDYPVETPDPKFDKYKINYSE